MPKETAEGLINIIGTMMLSFALGTHFGAWIGWSVAGSLTLMFGIFGGKNSA